MKRGSKATLCIALTLLALLPGFLTLQNLYAMNLPYLSISVSATSVPLGGAVTVSSLLTGATASASGHVTYSEYSGATCSGSLVITLTGTVKKGVVKSVTFVMAKAGTFSFQGVYSGDAKNYPATSLCSDSVKVSGTPTTITTTLVTPPPPKTTIPVGKSVTDSATLAGTNVGASTIGTVTYNLFYGPTCSAGIAQSQTVIVAGGTVPNSNPFTINNAGTYSLKAVYSGDSLNAGSTSSCEGPLTVAKLTPTLGTTFSASSVIVGGTISDAATLTGGTSTAGGTVTYYLFGNGVCNGASIASYTVTVTNGVVPASTNFIITSVGSGELSFTAIYSGDKNNAGVPSGCESQIDVKKATPTLSTTLSTFSITAGGSITDSARLTGATSSAGGTVTYELWDDGTCGTSGGTIVQSQTVIVTGGSVPSVIFTINTSGSYSIGAIYSGDANNKSTSSGCEGIITVS
jgi:hypothetical protein